MFLLPPLVYELPDVVHAYGRRRAVEGEPGADGRHLRHRFLMRERRHAFPRRDLCVLRGLARYELGKVDEVARAQAHLIQSLKANKVPALFNTTINEIRGTQEVREVELYNTQTKAKTRMSVNGVFIAVGYDPEVGLAKKLGLELTPEGYIKVDARHRTAIPGIFAAGDVASSTI